MGLKRQIIKEIVAPQERNYYDMVQAEVTEYNEYNNKASVVFQDPRGPGMMELKDVPVQLGSGGVHSSGPFAGDTVWVNFNNRNPLYPKIVSLADKDYEKNTRERFNHESQGAYTFDYEKHAIKKYKVISEAWINKDKNKNYDFYTNINPRKELEWKSSQIKYYKSGEVGLTHPENGSTIKIAEDGCITMFTGVGEGIKINPNDHSVTILSGNTINNRGEVTDNMNNWTINCEDEIILNSKGSTTINSQENIIMTAKEFYFRKTKEGEEQWLTLPSQKEET